MGQRKTSKKRPSKPQGNSRPQLSNVLLEVNQKWLSSLDLEKVLPEVVSLTQRVLGADDVSLLLVDESGKELIEHVIVSRRRAPDNRFRIRIRAEGITGWVAANRKAQVVGDVTKDRRYVPTSDRIRSEAAVPVLAGERLLGVLNVESGKVGYFSKDSLRLLEMLASQIAIALTNAEVHDHERRRGQQLLILHHLSRAAGGAIPPKSFLHRVAEAVRREFSCYYTAVFLGDYSKEELVLLTQSCASEAAPEPGSTQPFGVGLIGTAFKIGEILNCRNVRQDPLYVEKVPGIQSELCVPVRVGDRALGLFDAQSRQMDAFGQDEVVFLETVASFLVPTLQALSPS